MLAGAAITDAAETKMKPLHPVTRKKIAASAPAAVTLLRASVKPTASMPSSKTQAVPNEAPFGVV